jgi:transmembrane sensor
MQKVVPIDSASSAEAQAREWIVRIDAGALDAEARARLTAWLAEDVRHAELLDTHALLWSAAGRAKFPAAAEAANEPFTSHGRSNARWRGPLAVALGSLAAAAAVFFALPDFGGGHQPQSTFNTALGQHRPVELQDGSSVHLNTASSMTVNFSKEKRRVLLERGEGYFAVAKDASRPFEVTAGSTVVRAVGTRFTVRRLDNGGAEVVVYEGIVEVKHLADGPDQVHAGTSVTDQQPIRLGVGQAAMEFKDKTVLRSLDEPELHRELAWQQDRIVFENTPLSDAVDQVNRYSNIRLVISDPTLADVPVSGAFSTQDIPVFLRSLERGFGLRVQQRSGQYEITRGLTS